MSSPLQNNITNLQNILNMVNTLPEVGSGSSSAVTESLNTQTVLISDIEAALEGKAIDSGGASIGNCAVTIGSVLGGEFLVLYETISNDTSVATYVTGSDLELSVRCGSGITIVDTSQVGFTYCGCIGSAQTIYNGGSASRVFYVQAPLEVGAEADITLS